MRENRLVNHKLRVFECILTGIITLVLYANTAVGVLAPDPLQSVKDQVRTALASAAVPPSTGFTRNDYLATINGIVNFFRTYQLSDGTIIDPYTGNEIQYSTPYYALCGSVLIKSGYRTEPDFLESVSLALDRATYELYTSTCATSHSNFFTVPSVLAYENLRDRVLTSRRTLWETRLTGMPSSQYATHTLNWTLTASCGEYLRYINGFTTNTTYMTTWITNNLPQLTLQGLYRDGGYPYAPMAYDGFARLNLNLVLLRGYGGTTFPGSQDFPEYMRRGAWTGLLMQSPWGETPLGGRSAQHQWNETQMCFMYEVWANQANTEGDSVSAGAFKRAAHLAYQSLRRWIRPDGSVWIVKNRMDPANRFGYETYSYLSQYNMWTAGGLALAWEYANDTISERACPADIGGYAFQVPEFHKGFANCQGLYLEIDMDPEDNYDIAGLVRLHKAGVEPLVCPSAPTTNLAPLVGTPELGTGIGWYTGSAWTSLADVENSQISSFGFTVNSMSSAAVDFSVTYNFTGVAAATSVTEHYTVTPDQAIVNASVTGTATQTKMRYAAFLSDGQRDFTVGYGNGLAQTKLGDSLMTMQLTSHPSTPFNRTNSYVNSRNGYLEAIEGIVNAQSITYVLKPELDPAGTKFIAANTFTGFEVEKIPAYKIVSSTAGSEETGNWKGNSYDNNPLTRWCNTGALASAWIQYDLGSTQVIDRVSLLYYKGYRIYPIKIEVSTNGTSWNQVFNGNSGQVDSAYWGTTFTPISGRYVKITMTANNSDSSAWFSIFETKISKQIVTCGDVILLGMGLTSDISGSGGSADCSVDTYDLAALAGEWLSSTPLKADISGPGGVPDNSVNLHDFAALADQWLRCNVPQDPDCL
jgi:hypothetical protein